MVAPTPGPWELHSNATDFVWLAIPNDNSSSWIAGPNDGKKLRRARQAQNEADGRLMVKSPELLALLKEWLHISGNEYHSYYGLSLALADWDRRARALVASIEEGTQSEEEPHVRKT